MKLVAPVQYLQRRAGVSVQERSEVKGDQRSTLGLHRNRNRAGNLGAAREANVVSEVSLGCEELRLHGALGVAVLGALGDAHPAGAAAPPPPQLLNLSTKL